MSKKTRYLKLATIALSATLTLGAIAPAYAADGASGTIPAIGKVSIQGSSYFELKQIHVLPSSKGKLATFTVTVHNQGSSELLFVDYWVRLKSKSGNQFSARLLPADKDKNRIPAGSSTDISFYANVNDSTKLQDLVVQFIKWDFNQANFERVLGEVAVPNTYTDVTPVDGYAVINAAGTELQGSVKKLVSNKNEKYHVPTVYITLENTGTHSLTVPAYAFSIRTSEGLLYPLEAKGLKDLTITPKESKELQLSGTIPVAVSAENWELVVTENNADLKADIPVATFKLPAVSQEQAGSLGKQYSFTSKSGVYTAELNALYRLPWEDDDILSADLTLSNKGTDSLPIPKLSGYFLLDDAVKVDAQLIQTAKVIGLGAGSKVNFQIAGKVPYTYEFSQIKLVLQEKESDTATTDVLEFSSQSELQAIPYHGIGTSYTLSDIGRKTNFKVRSVNTYASNTGSLFTAQLEATNLEKRYTNIAKLVAHFRAADGTVLPAAIAEVKNKIGPTGKALLNVSAILPKGFSTRNMNLIIGESVTDSKLTEGDGEADSYVKPVAFWLPDELNQVQSSLKNVDLFPYNVSISQIGTSIETSNFTLRFDYEITKDLLIESNVDGHRLVLVFEDGGGRKSFEKSFEVKDFDPVDGDTPETAGTKFKLGKHKEFKIQLVDPDMLYETDFQKKYTLSLYDEFQGQRKLLATQKADWFITTD